MDAASQAIDDVTPDDIDEQLRSAAQAVEEKLNEAGRKIEEFFNEPAMQRRTREASSRAGSFFDRAGKSIASGIDSLMKAFTRYRE